MQVAGRFQARPQRINFPIDPFNARIANVLFDCFSIQIKQRIFVALDRPPVVPLEGGTLGKFDPVRHLH